MTALPPEQDTIIDFTSQLSGNLGYPIAYGSFSEVYRCTVESRIGQIEVAVKVYRNDRKSSMDELTRSILRELKISLRLKHPNIVPLLGTAQVYSPLPALVSRWIPTGHLSDYLDKQATTITRDVRIKLVKGIAEGLNYLHSEDVIHGDLHPANVLIDGSGNPCITGFYLATVAGDPELQWTSPITEYNFHRWRAPEVIGIEGDPERPMFKSDIYSFGSVMFFIVSGDIPWKEKNLTHIYIGLWKRATPARPENISDYHWDVIQRCWCWDKGDRPEATRVLQFICVEDTTIDFTSQICDKLGSPIAAGSFADVYRCTIESRISETEVAVKVFKIDPGRSMDKLTNSMLRELEVWLKLRHVAIVPLLGTAWVNSPLLALVSPWIPAGKLSEYLGEKVTVITRSAGIKLVKGIAEGLNYLHSENVIHGDLHPGNVLIDGSGNPCLTDFGLATVAGNPELQWTSMTARCNFDPRWRAPEVVGIEGDPERPTFKSDIYSFGSVMFFTISKDIPWKEKTSFQICIELSKRATPARPDNISNDHWDLIRQCWSWKMRDRPEAMRILQILSPAGLDSDENITLWKLLIRNRNKGDKMGPAKMAQK